MPILPSSIPKHARNASSRSMWPSATFRPLSEPTNVSRPTREFSPSRKIRILKRAGTPLMRPLLSTRTFSASGAVGIPSSPRKAHRPTSKYPTRTMQAAPSYSSGGLSHPPMKASFRSWKEFRTSACANRAESCSSGKTRSEKAALSSNIFMPTSFKPQYADKTKAILPGGSAVRTRRPKSIWKTKTPENEEWTNHSTRLIRRTYSPSRE
ncbi:hypothetical protein AC781_11275 [Akkermansia glycaniphila]|nr:hypothetical protein AC781_11275 [Akkermansia glycaniphila]